MVKIKTLKKIAIDKIIKNFLKTDNILKEKKYIM